MAFIRSGGEHSPVNRRTLRLVANLRRGRDAGSVGKDATGCFALPILHIGDTAQSHRGRGLIPAIRLGRRRCALKQIVALLPIGSRKMDSIVRHGLKGE
jgi:hypothetical protein